MALTISSIAQAVKPSSTLAITAKAKEMKAKGLDVVAFTAGEPDFNTPANVNAVAIEAIQSGFTKYTAASGIQELKEAISKKFLSFNKVEYKPEQIVISNGGKHSLTNIFRVLINPGDEVIIPAPYWLSYPEMVKLAGGVPVIVYGAKETDYKVTAAQIEAAVTVNTKALIINTPSNPTGMVYSKEELEEIAAVSIAKDFYVIADEMYENLIYGEVEHVSIASLGKDIYDRTITCSGLSKSYAMTGWRVGYTGSSLELAKLMGSVQSHCTSNVNSIAQKAAVEALNGPQGEVAAMKEAFHDRLEYMSERVSKMPYISFIKPQGAFYLFIDVEPLLKMSYKGEKLIDGAHVADVLVKDYLVTVIPCADFGFANHIRLAYAIDLAQIEKGLDRIEAFLSELQ